MRTSGGFWQSSQHCTSRPSRLTKIRFNLQIAALTSAVKERPADFRHWALGAPGHCAIQWPGHAIVLGDLDQAECRELAKAATQTAYPGVVGSDQTAHWFVQHATAMGAHFADPSRNASTRYPAPRAIQAPPVRRARCVPPTRRCCLNGSWVFISRPFPTTHRHRWQASRRLPPAGAFYFGRSTSGPFPSRPLRGVCGTPELSLPFTRRPSTGAGVRRLSDGRSRRSAFRRG